MESGLEKGREAPDWFLDEPSLLTGDEFYIEEFWILDSGRQRIGGSIGPISVERIERRGEVRHEFDEDALVLYVCVMRALDDEYLTWKQEEYDREARSRGKGGGASKSDGKGPAKGKNYQRDRKRVKQE